MPKVIDPLALLRVRSEQLLLHTEVEYHSERVLSRVKLIKYYNTAKILQDALLQDAAF